MEEKPKEKWRANYLPAPHYYNLNQACLLLNKALGFNGEGHCYLVGSSRERRDYRDVDVRFIMADESFDRLFRVRPEDADSNASGWANPLWSLMCTTISMWLSKQTDLPIDFQIQRRTQANELHPGPGRRCALGIFLDYPGERPSDVVKETPCASPTPGSKPSFLSPAPTEEVTGTSTPSTAPTESSSGAPAATESPTFHSTVPDPTA